MTDDPFLTLLVEALNLMHPRFAAADMRAEFYHQFRRLWDKALPVKLGLGHVILQSDPDAPPGPRPDFLFWQIGEHGRSDSRLGTVSLVDGANAMALDAQLMLLTQYKRDLGYLYAVCVIVGPDDGTPSIGGVTRIVYDTERHDATVV